MMKPMVIDTMRRLCLFALPSSFLAVTLPIAGCGASKLDAQTDPVAELTAMFTAMQASWNSNNAAAYTASFSDDIDFINIRGDLVIGKPGVLALHEKLFAGPFKGSKVTITIRKTRNLGVGVAVVDTDQNVVDYAFLPPGISATSENLVKTRFKYIVVRQPDLTWKIIAGQNTSIVPQ